MSIYNRDGLPSDFWYPSIIGRDPVEPPEGQFSGDEIEAAKLALACGDWLERTEDVRDWLKENAADFILDLVFTDAQNPIAAELKRATAIRKARSSCIEYLVRNMDDQRAIDEIDVDGSAA